MKGKDKFTSAEITKLKELIVLRNNTAPSGQKAIRQKMRNLGFYGKDDWGIVNLKIEDLNILIKSGRIKVVGNDDKKQTPICFPTKNLTKTVVFDNTHHSGSSPKDLEFILNNFKANRFDPITDSEAMIPDSSGNYILCLRKNSKLPKTSALPTLTDFEGLQVIYTGIAGNSLRTRDYRQHFKGNNAGRSTLRKSLGVLFGYKQIPRDSDVNSGKTKFIEKDEKELTEWMHSNLIMYFLPTVDFNRIEIELINHFNPPLNLKDNHNHINIEFRQLLSNLRTLKCL